MSSRTVSWPWAHQALMWIVDVNAVTVAANLHDDVPVAAHFCAWRVAQLRMLVVETEAIAQDQHAQSVE